MAALSHPMRVPLRDDEDQGGHRREEQGESAPVEGDPGLEMSAPRHEDQGGHHPEETDRDVHEKDEAPAAGNEQQTAHRRAEREPERLGRSLDAERTTET